MSTRKKGEGVPGSILECPAVQSSFPDFVKVTKAKRRRKQGVEKREEKEEGFSWKAQGRKWRPLCIQLIMRRRRTKPGLSSADILEDAKLLAARRARKMDQCLCGENSLSCSGR